MLRYVLVDGAAVAWVPPHAERYLIGPQPGRYSIGFRDFFGTEVTPAQVVHLPARVVVGPSGPDAGVVKPEP